MSPCRRRSPAILRRVGRRASLPPRGHLAGLRPRGWAVTRKARVSVTRVPLGSVPLEPLRGVCVQLCACPVVTLSLVFGVSLLGRLFTDNLRGKEGAPFALLHKIICQ